MFNIQLAKEEGNIGILRYAVALILATYLHPYQLYPTLKSSK